MSALSTFARPIARSVRTKAAFDPDSTPKKLGGATPRKLSEDELPPLPPLPDLRKLAEMAAIKITDEEVEAWTPKVHSIVQWFGKLREVDISGLDEYQAPGREGLMATDWMREDEPVAFEDTKELMEESRLWDGKFIRVAAVGGSAGTDFGETKSADAGEAPASAAASVELNDDLLGMELKVGKVLTVERHPESEKLYIETIECGEDEPRLICSGLAPYMSEEALLGKNVVIVANLKPRNMAGVKSNGMVLAASDAAHENVEILCAPEGAVPGERITWGGAENIEPHGVNKVAKKKIWEEVQRGLGTNDALVATWNGVPMMTSAGQCSCASLANANVG
jgi:aminoacyl tRNA synthase complex-interacting multifunctional protein 1